MPHVFLSDWYDDFIAAYVVVNVLAEKLALADVMDCVFI